MFERRVLFFPEITTIFTRVIAIVISGVNSKEGLLFQRPETANKENKRTLIVIDSLFIDCLIESLFEHIFMSFVALLVTHLKAHTST